jgi:prepilin-type N-terminal cleavage/methylation domain-containing protein
MKKLRLSKQTRKSLQGRSRGLTMIEVLIAIAILGIISVAFMGALSTATTTVVIGDERTTAESLARRQMEYVKGQGYRAESVLAQPIYQKISGIPEGYAIWSVNRTGEIAEEITGIPWDSDTNRPIDTDKGLQKIALVITHEDKVIYTFINDNPNWADGVEITLEGYKVDR